MIPGDLLGVIAFAAAVGPGYIYVQVADRFRPPRERTGLKEAAELVVIGSAATTLGLTVALIVGKITGYLDAGELVNAPASYLVSQPEDAGAGLCVLLFVSYVGTWAVARIRYSGQTEIHPDSGWYGAFERDLPEDHGIYATVELRDGRVLAGVVRSFTAEPSPIDERELSLHAPDHGRIRARTKDGREENLPDDFVLLRGSDIVYISARYLATS